MKISEIVNFLDNYAPASFKEDYDNVGLLVGNRNEEIKSVLISLDVTEDVVNEAILKGANLIVSHHPIIFRGLKKIVESTEVERVISKAIKNDIAIYAAHTNLDNIDGGVNTKIAEKLNLSNTKFILPYQNNLKKLVVFVPESHIEKVRTIIFDAGAGQIGNYDNTAYYTKGEGSFRALEGATPFVGEQGKLHFEKEIRFETIYPQHLEGKIISAMLNAHPYEEVAYDIYSLNNKYKKAGTGIIGKLPEALTEEEFLALVKKTFKAEVIRHTNLKSRKIKKVAVCGGTCSFIINSAISAGADVLITADVKYHEFFDIENRIFLLDIGHYESEQYTKEIFYDILTKKFSNFAINLSEINTNPIKYYK